MKSLISCDKWTIAALADRLKRADPHSEYQRIQTLHGLTPSNEFLKATGYALKREQQLKVFLENPEVPLDTNHLERALRVIPMGKKNWLFCWTEIGAHYLGVLQSLITTCKLQHINPVIYLTDVLLRINLHPMTKIDDLIPRNWKSHFSDCPLRSDLHSTRKF